MVRSLGLKPGDKLVAELIDDHIVLLPQPESWLDYFMGSMKGVYGSTKEEIDRYIAEERASPERWEWYQQFYDLLATDLNVRAVVEALRSFDHCTASSSQLLDSPLVRGKGLSEGQVEEALKRLVKHGGVRKILPQVKPQRQVYRLVHEFADEGSQALR